LLLTFTNLIFAAHEAANNFDFKNLGNWIIAGFERWILGKYQINRS
jgi:hypothetical protein